MAAPPPPLHLEPDPVIEMYKRDVDRTLLRESLRLTVDERLTRLSALIDAAHELDAMGARIRQQHG